MPLITGASGGGGAATLITSQVLTGSQATFDTNTLLGGNISAGFNHLQIVLTARCDDAATNEFVDVRFNNDSGANYDFVICYTTGGSAPVNSPALVAQSSVQLGRMAGSTATAGRFGGLTAWIPNYAGTTADKVIMAKWHTTISTAAAGVLIGDSGGTWRNTAAITRITVLDDGGGNFVAGSAFYLYGIT